MMSLFVAAVRAFVEMLPFAFVGSCIPSWELNMSESIRSSLSSRTLAVTESVQAHDHLAQHGFTMLEGVFAIPEIETLGIRLDTAFLVEDEPSTLRSRGQTYGSRNLLQ